MIKQLLIWLGIKSSTKKPKQRVINVSYDNGETFVKVIVAPDWEFGEPLKQADSSAPNTNNNNADLR